MTIDREFITPIGSSLSPNIAGLAELESDWVLWKNIDVVNLDFVENGKKIAFI